MAPVPASAPQQWLYYTEYLGVRYCRKMKYPKLPAPQSGGPVRLVSVLRLLIGKHSSPVLLFIVRSVADQECLSRIPGLNFFHPGSEFFHPGSRIRSKKFEYLIQKMNYKLSEIWSGFLIADPDPEFSPIPDPRVKKAPDHDPQNWLILKNQKDGL